MKLKYINIVLLCLLLQTVNYFIVILTMNVAQEQYNIPLNLQEICVQGRPCQLCIHFKILPQ